MRRIPMYMEGWISKLDGFLSLNDRDILNHAGKVSHQLATDQSEEEYRKFHTNRIKVNDQHEDDFEKITKQLLTNKQ